MRYTKTNHEHKYFVNEDRQEECSVCTLLRSTIEYDHIVDTNEKVGREEWDWREEFTNEFFPRPEGSYISWYIDIEGHEADEMNKNIQIWIAKLLSQATQKAYDRVLEEVIALEDIYTQSAKVF